MYHYSIRPTALINVYYYYCLPLILKALKAPIFKRAGETGGVEKESRVGYEGSSGPQGPPAPCSLPITDTIAPLSPLPETHQRRAMPSTTTLASNPPPRRTSPIVETIQRSPVLSPRTAEPRQQRSGSVHPSSPPHRTPTPPQRISTPPQPPPEQKTENGSHDPQVSTRQFLGPVLLSSLPPRPLAFSLWYAGPRVAHDLLPRYVGHRNGNVRTDPGDG